MIDEKKFAPALAALDKAYQHQKNAKDKAYYDGMLTMLKIVVSNGWTEDILVRKGENFHYIFDETDPAHI
jgi:hypothetical protein